MFERASQTVYTEGYISVLQTLNNNESIDKSLDIDSDVVGDLIWRAHNCMIKIDILFL